MMNALTLAGALFALAALALVLWGVVASVRAVLRRSAYLRRPIGGEGQSIWTGAMEAKDVYVPGTILRKLGLILLGLLVGALGAPFLWAGLALADFVAVKETVTIARVSAAEGGGLSVEPAVGVAVQGTLPDGILVAHAEFLSFRGWFEKAGLGTYARPVSLSSFANSAAVLQRKGRGRLEVRPPSRLYGYAERLQRRFPDQIEAARRFTGPLERGASAELVATTTEIAWKK